MKTLVVDGSNLFWRVAKIMPILTTDKGMHVQVVYGFLRALHASIEKFEPTHCIVAWDNGLPLARLAVWSGYKRSRIEKKALKTKHDEPYRQSISQLDFIKTLLPHLKIIQVEYRNTEADDLIAMSCKYLPGKKIVVSADRDMMQLVNKRTKVYFPFTDTLYSIENFKAKTGLTPEQFADVKAICGDATDGVPGICRGVGPKSIIALMQEFGSAFKIRKHIHEIAKRGKKFGKLKSNWRLYERNRLLVNLSIIESKSFSKQLRLEVKKCSKKKVNVLGIRKCFVKNQFRSLLKQYLVWIRPFEALGD